MTVYAIIEENKSLWMFEDVRTRNIWLTMFYDGKSINQKEGKQLMTSLSYSKHAWEEPKIKGVKKMNFEEKVFKKLLKIFLDEINTEFKIDKTYITSPEEAEKIFGSAMTILSNFSANALGNLYRQYVHSDLKLKQIVLHEFLTQFDNVFETYLKKCGDK